jgi:hypothetical protein
MYNVMLSGQFGSVLSSYVITFCNKNAIPPLLMLGLLGLSCAAYFFILQETHNQAVSPDVQELIPLRNPNEIILNDNNHINLIKNEKNIPVDRINWNVAKIISNTIESNINNSSSSKKNENENVLKLETVQKTSYSELVEISNSPIRNHPEIKVSENEINNF